MIKIRKYSENDLDFISEKQSLLSGFHFQFDKEYYEPSDNSRQEFKDYIAKRITDENFNILIAESSGKITGYVMGWIDLRPPIYKIRNVGYLSNIFVNSDQRNSGIGKELYNEMEKWFLSKNVDYIEIKSDARNTDTINKFRNHGFRDLSITFYKKAK
ncbi:MAG: GNAT family N-acetyltransferase [Bacteroidota bacterium]|nr:GNAT family N-acetyltransferase [Bacteroidota bacterium]